MPDLTNTAIANPEVFEERLKNVPHTPGVYIWKDAFGKILYVGKSKVLRDRMRSYLGSPRGLNSKTRRMVAQIADFEIIRKWEKTTEIGDRAEIKTLPEASGAWAKLDARRDLRLLGDVTARAPGIGRA